MVLTIFGGVMTPHVFASDDACAVCHENKSRSMARAGPHSKLDSDCLTCHISHGNGAPLAHDKSFFLKAAGGALCGQCHATVTQKEFVHAPAKQDCTLCHDPHGALRKELRAESNALCLECHSAAAKARFEADGPVKLFGGQVTLPHGLFHDVPVLALSDDRGHPVSNHPVLRKKDKDWPAVECLACHNAHGANRSRVFLVTETETFEQLCLRCHQ